jgi:hypothetical protein
VVNTSHHPTPFHAIIFSMENKKLPERYSKPDTQSRFAEVTRLSKEARARKPKQVPDEQRPNPYKIDLPNDAPLKEKEG